MGIDYRHDPSTDTLRVELRGRITDSDLTTLYASAERDRELLSAARTLVDCRAVTAVDVTLAGVRDLAEQVRGRALIGSRAVAIVTGDALVHGMARLWADRSSSDRSRPVFVTRNIVEARRFLGLVPVPLARIHPDTDADGSPASGPGSAGIA